MLLVSSQSIQFCDFQGKSWALEFVYLDFPLCVNNRPIFSHDLSYSCLNLKKQSSIVFAEYF